MATMMMERNSADFPTRVEEKMAMIRHHHKKAPVNMIPLAEDLGIKVYYATFSDDSISGMIERSERGGPSGYAIFVNKAHHSNRRRFTMAHEIAHYVLHQDLIGDALKDDALYRSGLSGKHEAQANSLAAEILMPMSLVQDAVNRGNTSVETLAHLFQVSRSAMSIRLGVPYEQ